MENVNVLIIASENSTGQQTSPNTMGTFVVNPSLVFRAPFVPTALSMAVTIVTSGLKANQNYKFEVQVINNQLEKIIYTTGINDFVLPGEMDNFIFNLDLKNLEFMNIGVYTIRFEINGKVFNSYFEVRSNKILNVSEG